MKTTRYFEEQVLWKPRYLKRERCEQALRDLAHREMQPDGCVRYWMFVQELREYLRVITLEDGATVHNASPDRGFNEEE